VNRALWIAALLGACVGCGCAAVRTTPAPGKTVISKASWDLWANTSVMVISSKGTVVLMDAFMTLPGIRPDLVTVSHFHGDHFDPFLLGFVRSARSTSKVESFTYKDVRVEGLASTHGGKIDADFPTNVVYILTVDAIRIAHLGDFGQSEFTEEQRRALAGVDVLIAPFTYSLVPDDRSVALVRQIKPRMLLPTHRTRNSLRMLKASADDVIVRDDRIEIGPADLTPGRTQLVLLERSDYAFLFLRFLVIELPAYPITKFALAMILAAVCLWRGVRWIRRRRMSVTAV
jgi:L-ascorbate metabolism protein UlaG (beta-lactamase superfamily)